MKKEQKKSSPAPRSQADEEKLCDALAEKGRFRRVILEGAVRRYVSAPRQLTLWFVVAGAEIPKPLVDWMLEEVAGGELGCCGRLEDLSRVMVSVSRAGANAKDSLAVCKAILDRCVRNGYRVDHSLRS